MALTCIKLAFCILVALELTANVKLEQKSNFNQVNTFNRAAQNQFIEWVLSLINQRPPAIAPTAIISTTVPATLSTTTEAASTTTEAPEPSRNCTDCVCGITNKKKRIVGGQETEVNQYPWMAMLLYKGRFYCAATLINDQYVLTASHCIYGFKKEFLSVRLLDHSRSMSSPTKIDRGVDAAITHPLYNSRNYDNDIAILRLTEPVEIKELLRPVCMPTSGKSFSGDIGIVTGWGATKESGATSDTLQEVQVPIMSNDDCRKSRYGSSRISDNMLCAGLEKGQKDSCQGDSGGPLHVVDGVGHQIAGIVSWGEGCAKPGYPGVYARVNRYGTWIKSKTNDACKCHSEVKLIK